MRAFWAAALCLVLAACGARQANEFPEASRAAFHSECPANNPVCVCTWEEITHTLTFEQYETALETFRAEGRMDPRVTRASTKCRERHMN